MLGSTLIASKKQIGISRRFCKEGLKPPPRILIEGGRGSETLKKLFWEGEFLFSLKTK